MESKLNVIEMRKFETKEDLVEWIEIMHLQNTNGRETPDEMFKLGIEAAIEELTEFNLFSIPVVVSSAKIKEPTFAEMRKKVVDSKQFTKKDGLWHHRTYGWKNLREAYEIANK